MRFLLRILSEGFGVLAGGLNFSCDIRAQAIKQYYFGHFLGFPTYNYKYVIT